MTTIDVARQLGLKQIRVRGNQASACCPFHHDRVPSLSMNVEREQWFCHAGCGYGNMTTLVARVKNISTGEAHARIKSGDVHAPAARSNRDVYIRKTDDRATGSFASIERDIRHALHLLEDEEMDSAAVVRILMQTFNLSRATAYRRVGIATGRLRPVGRTLVRSFHILKQIRQSCADHLARVRAERRAWSLLQEENLRHGFGRRRPVTIQRLVQEARDWLNTPAPPIVMHPGTSGRPIKSQYHPLFNFV
jgi:CHC2 zinc finger